jgi:catechol-2,3-dioxygenase
LLNQLLVFYTEVVGLRVGARPPFTRPGYWLYAGEQDVLHLLEASPDEVRAIDIVTTFDHTAFNYTGRQEFEQRLKQRGIPFQLTRIPTTGQMQLMFKDPAGNGVELNFSGD